MWVNRYVVVVALSTAGIGGSASAGTVFDFTGNAAKRASFSFAGTGGGDPATVTVIGQERDGTVWKSRHVTRTASGLGVTDKNDFLDKLLDGADDRERLVLTFSRQVKLKSLTFAGADVADDVAIKPGYMAAAAVAPSFSLEAGAGHLQLYTLDVSGLFGPSDVFKVVARSADDGVKLVSAELATAVPLPPAAVSGLALLGGIGAVAAWRRRARG